MAVLCMFCFLILMYVHVCVVVCGSAHGGQKSALDPWESNSGPLKEQEAEFLTAGPFLQPHGIFFFSHLIHQLFLSVHGIKHRVSHVLGKSLP